MTYKQFLIKITEDTNYLDQASIDYNTYHARRFYETYKECSRFLKKGDELISLGAGCAPIEKMLHENIGVDITVVDFPDLIDYFAPYYKFLGFKTFSADLTKDKLNLPPENFDMLLASEVVEHIPKSIYHQMLPFDKSLKKGARIVITTPNFCSIIQILKLIFMKPVLPPAERFFSEVSVENQAIHRREYLPVEVSAELTRLSYKHISTKYFFYTYSVKFLTKILYLVAGIIPRFRTGMLIVGQK